MKTQEEVKTAPTPAIEKKGGAKALGWKARVEKLRQQKEAEKAKMEESKASITDSGSVQDSQLSKFKEMLAPAQGLEKDD